jgi:hypothetical protein
MTAMGSMLRVVRRSVVCGRRKIGSFPEIAEVGRAQEARRPRRVMPTMSSFTKVVSQTSG